MWERDVAQTVYWFEQEPSAAGGQARARSMLWRIGWFGGRRDAEDELLPGGAVPAVLFMVIAALGVVLAYAVYSPARVGVAAGALCVALVVALIVSLAVKVANPWDRAVVLRLGRFRELEGPGLFAIVGNGASANANKEPAAGERTAAPR
jgi:hypothetical protein